MYRELTVPDETVQVLEVLEDMYQLLGVPEGTIQLSGVPEGASQVLKALGGRIQGLMVLGDKALGLGCQIDTGEAPGLLEGVGLGQGHQMKSIQVLVSLGSGLLGVVGQVQGCQACPGCGTWRGWPHWSPEWKRCSAEWRSRLQLENKQLRGPH